MTLTLPYNQGKVGRRGLGFAALSVNSFRHMKCSVPHLSFVTAGLPLVVAEEFFPPGLTHGRSVVQTSWTTPLP